MQDLDQKASLRFPLVQKTLMILQARVPVLRVLRMKTNGTSQQTGSTHNKSTEAESTCGMTLIEHTGSAPTVLPVIHRSIQFAKQTPMCVPSHRCVEEHLSCSESWGQKGSQRWRVVRGALSLVSLTLLPQPRQVGTGLHLWRLSVTQGWVFIGKISRTCVAFLRCRHCTAVISHQYLLKHQPQHPQACPLQEQEVSWILSLSQHDTSVVQKAACKAWKPMDP